MVIRNSFIIFLLMLSACRTHHNIQGNDYVQKKIDANGVPYLYIDRAPPLQKSYWFKSESGAIMFDSTRQHAWYVLALKKLQNTGNVIRLEIEFQHPDTSRPPMNITQYVQPHQQYVMLQSPTFPAYLLEPRVYKIKAKIYDNDSTVISGSHTQNILWSASAQGHYSGR